MRIRLVVVGPKYQMNVGYVARVSANFGIENIVFVKPRADIHGKKAVMFSKHGHMLLENARVVGSLDEALGGCRLAVGTTGIWRSGKRLNEHEYTLEEAGMLFAGAGYRNSTIGLILGRDDKGLSREELEQCDILLHIPADRKYPVLNISHALAIILYSLSMKGERGYGRVDADKAGGAELKVLRDAFSRSLKGKKVRNRRAVNNIFGKMLRRAELNKSEVHAMITAFK